MKNMIKIVAAIIVLIIALMMLQTKNFNGFAMARFYEGKTVVSRDRKEQYQNEWAYKIESKDYNDFMMYKTIPVKKNTAYKVSCMVKTKDVVSQSKQNGGFCIGLRERLEKSPSVSGTTDWTNVEFYFNSYEDETLDIAFRLGDNDENCKGTAWFSNIRIETGSQKQTTDWKFAVFMINHTKAEANNRIINEDLNMSHVGAIKNSLEGFTRTAQNFSKNNINASYDIFEVNEPLKHVSYDRETGYYVSPQDVYTLINRYLYNGENYDHIFIVANIGDTIGRDKIDWIGLGGMVYDNIGYSNIRISNSTMHLYQSSNSNFFSEEIMLHEFLHTLEKNSIRMKNSTIALHDYEKYGYKNEARYGLRDWYQDYMQKTIKGKLGLEEEVFYTQPVSKKNFVKRNTMTGEIYNKQNIVQKIMEKISRIV